MENQIIVGLSILRRETKSKCKAVPWKIPLLVFKHVSCFFTSFVFFDFECVFTPAFSNLEHNFISLYGIVVSRYL